MRRSLGLCVTSGAHERHLLGLLAAARRQGIRTDVFLTGDGVVLAGGPGLASLLHHADRVGVCEVSARDRGLPPGSVAGIGEKDFVTQARNAELVASCDRYLVL